MGHRVPISGGEVAAALEARSREPFTQALAELMACKPSLEVLYRFANSAPHRWVQAVAVLARLVGYHDKLEVKGDMSFAALNRMSDMELEQKSREIAARIMGSEGDQPADQGDGKVVPLRSVKPDGPKKRDDG